MIYPTVLEARVAARNDLNKKIRKVVPQILENIKPLIGKKVMTNEGLTKEFKNKLGNLYFGDGFCGYVRTPIIYSISLTFYVDRSYKKRDYDGSTREEATVYIGDVSGKTLEMVYPFNPDNYSREYTVEEIIAARKNAEALRKQLQDAESNLFPFGTYDPF